jgi:exodeoxyribonuclease VIII
MTIPDDGIHPGIPADVYHRWDAYSASSLKTAARSLAHYHHELTHPRDPTAALILGAATHACIGEPDKFAAEYAKAPKVDKRTKAGKAEWAEFATAHAEATILTADEYGLCEAMSAAVWAHPVASQMLKGEGKNELSVVWHDEDDAPCKARVDRIQAWDGWTRVIDYKTAVDASPHGFARAIGQYRYDWQAAHYLDGLDTIQPRPRKFTFIAIEKEPPHAIGIYELQDWCLDQARDEVRAVKAAIRKAHETNEWPGYPAEVVELELPRWRWQSEE